MKINIEFKNGKKIVTINNKTFEAHHLSGMIAKAGDISKYDPHDLGYLQPILVNFGCTYCGKNKLTALKDNISAEFFLDDDANVIPLITITDPIDIITDEMHKKYQKALYSVIKSKDFIWFPEDFSITGTELVFCGAGTTKSQKKTYKRKCVNDVQFSFVIEAGTYKEVFIKLNEVIGQLDKEARDNMK